MNVKQGFSLTQAMASLYQWIGDMAWLFRNISRVRNTVEGAQTHAPFCPRHEARMEFQDEEPYRGLAPGNEFLASGCEFRRNYKCPLCDYRTFTLYLIKRA